MDEQAANELLRSGHEALAAADWPRATSCLEQAREFEETAEILDGLGQAAHFQGDFDAAIEYMERAFAAYRGQGNREQAADLARWLAFLHGMVRANWAVCSGWMGRAESLLEGVEATSAHGWLALDQAVFIQEISEREQLATAALAIARRFGDSDLEFSALALIGQMKVASGHIGDGMALLDQAMAAVSGGEVVLVGAIGEIYCRLLSACELATDVRRAEQWTAGAARFVAWREWVAPTCRCHLGGILIAVGRWDEAEEQLLTALRVFDRGYRAARVSALVRLADLRVRQGRFEEAERLIEGAEADPSVRPILAAIALARGDLALAEELACLCLEGREETEPGCAPLLEVLLRVQLGRGDADGACGTLERLQQLASGSADERAAAAAQLAAGLVCAAAGDPHAATHLKHALEGFAALDLPLEAARAQVELARALAPGAPEAAAAEARFALATFERLGATRDMDATAEVLRGLGAGGGRAWPRRHGLLTKRETEVLSLLAAGCSNGDIAGRLVISRRTAEHHVASILSKLNLRSRAEAAAYVARAPSQDP